MHDCMWENQPFVHMPRECMKRGCIKKNLWRYSYAKRASNYAFLPPFFLGSATGGTLLFAGAWLVTPLAEEL